MREAEVERKTKETEIYIKINLDGKGEYKIDTPNGFFNHMLELLAKHSGIDMEISVKGDTEVDLHHTVEDTGIELGKAINKALGDRKGIERYSSIMMPMDEVRVDVAIDLGGRSNLKYWVQNLDIPIGNQSEKDQGFDYTTIKEFMKALSDNMKSTIHVAHYIYSGESANKHHIAEAIFKGLARTLRQAVKITGKDIPSTKGII